MQISKHIELQPVAQDVRLPGWGSEAMRMLEAIDTPYPAGA